MAINDNGLFEALSGTVFFAPAETAIPTEGVKAFTLTAETVGTEGVWKNLGHTSDDNRIEVTADGGESTSRNTWLKKNARVTYDPTTMSITGHSVQADADSLKQLFNGWDSGDGGIVVGAEKEEQKLALFILAEDTTTGKNFGLYFPNTSFTYSSDGFVDLSPDGFTEFAFEAQVLSSTTAKKSSSGKSGLFVTYPPEAFEPAA